MQSLSLLESRVDCLAPFALERILIEHRWEEIRLYYDGFLLVENFQCDGASPRLHSIFVQYLAGNRDLRFEWKGDGRIYTLYIAMKDMFHALYTVDCKNLALSLVKDRLTINALYIGRLLRFDLRNSWQRNLILNLLDIIGHERAAEIRAMSRVM